MLIEGAIFTNALGPVLVNNPWLTVKILEISLKNKGIDFRDFQLDMELEKKSFDVKKEFILTKKTELRNCYE